MYVLEAKGIKKSFGKLDVLKGVDLSVSRGDAIAIIGPSGSGKSTFLRSLINLEKIDAGTIMVEGQPVVENGIYVKSDEAREAYKEWFFRTSTFFRINQLWRTLQWLLFL